MHFFPKIQFKKKSVLEAPIFDAHFLSPHLQPFGPPKWKLIEYPRPGMANGLHNQ